jgi:hypothetical protein
MCIRATWLKRVRIADCCEHGNELPGSINREEFRDYLCDYQLLSKGSALSALCMVLKLRSIFISAFPSDYVNLQKRPGGMKCCWLKLLSGQARRMVPVTQCIYGRRRFGRTTCPFGACPWVASPLCSLLQCAHKTVLCDTCLLYSSSLARESSVVNICTTSFDVRKVFVFPHQFIWWAGIA